MVETAGTNTYADSPERPVYNLGARVEAVVRKAASTEHPEYSQGVPSPRRQVRFHWNSASVKEPGDSPPGGSHRAAATVASGTAAGIRLNLIAPPGVPLMRSRSCFVVRVVTFDRIATG